jgi:hypothetical protein
MLKVTVIIGMKKLIYNHVFDIYSYPNGCDDGYGSYCFAVINQKSDHYGHYYSYIRNMPDKIIVEDELIDGKRSTYLIEQKDDEIRKLKIEVEKLRNEVNVIKCWMSGK